MSNKQLTPTSFAILGLLSIQPFTTYELAQQMDRTVSWFWPRAASMVYEEPKKLVTAGLATSRASFTGKRRSTVYEITAAGRTALNSSDVLLLGLGIVAAADELLMTWMDGTEGLTRERVVDVATLLFDATAHHIGS
jgi:DNA-binding PadR family transcriptional regulator